MHSHAIATSASPRAYLQSNSALLLYSRRKPRDALVSPGKRNVVRLASISSHRRPSGPRSASPHCCFRPNPYLAGMAKETPPLDELIACPHCDALYHVGRVSKGERAVCHRCHAKLISPRKAAGAHIIALALASVILVIGAL